jgi:hypothetical protein
MRCKVSRLGGNDSLDVPLCRGIHAVTRRNAIGSPPLASHTRHRRPTHGTLACTGRWGATLRVAVGRSTDRLALLAILLCSGPALQLWRVECSSRARYSTPIHRGRESRGPPFSVYGRPVSAWDLPPL